MVTASNLWQFIETHHRVTGKLPKLRECVEHFEDLKLNVMLSLGELQADKKDWIRSAARHDADMEREARKRRQL